MSLAIHGILFKCACVGTYVRALEIACFVFFSNVLGFISFMIGSLLSSDIRSYDLDGIGNNMHLSPRTRSY